MADFLGERLRERELRFREPSRLGEERFLLGLGERFFLGLGVVVGITNAPPVLLLCSKFI